MKQEFYIKGTAGRVHCCRWQPIGTPIGIIQIIHGIKEYVGRYDELAEYFTQRGYLVVGADHPGHGVSAANSGTLGYLPGGWIAAVQNIRLLQARMQNAHPELPYIMLGHSMGSFLLTTYLSLFSRSLDAAILSGTGWISDSVLSVGSIVCAAERKRLGDKAVSPLVEALMFGSYNSHFRPAKTKYDWLTSDDTVVKAYAKDPLCCWSASVQLCEEMIRAMRRNQKYNNLAKISNKLPIFFIAGQQDPVGNYGNGVLKAVEAFKTAGVRDCTVELYPNMRHECHNEIGKEKVLEDIAVWLESRIAVQHRKGCNL